MKLVDQWTALERDLPPGWERLRLTLTTEQAGDIDRAAQILGTMNVGRVGEELVLDIRPGGGMQSPEAARRSFARLDQARVWCLLGETAVQAGTLDRPPSGEEAHVPTAVESWDRALEPLPPDFTDLLCELELTSSDHLDRAALLCAPLNPTRVRDRLAFTFRCSGRSGYGASPGMVRTCCERLDAEGIPASASVTRALADLDNVTTQGAVWLVGGRNL